MKTVRVFLLVSLLVMTAGCASWAAAVPQIYRSNVLTAQHVSVKGTHVAVVPPSGAVQSSAFRGFEIPSRSIRYEIQEQFTPYANTERSILSGGLEARGLKTFDVTHVNLNNRPALLVTGEMIPPEDPEQAAQAEDTKVVLLVFGDERLSVSMYGFYPAADTAAPRTLRESMLSVVFVAEQRENAGGDYTLSSSGTQFQFAGEVGFKRYYTVGGVPIPSEVENALYIVTTLKQGVAAEARAELAERAMATFLTEYDYTVASRNNNVSYGGLPGIEIIADFEANTRRVRTASGGRVRRAIPAKGYQVMLFDSDVVYVFNGIAVRDADGYLQQFRNITATFRKN